MKGTSTRLEGIDWFLRIFFVPLPLSCPILAMISVWVWAVLFVFLASPFLYPLWIRIFFFCSPKQQQHTHTPRCIVPDSFAPDPMACGVLFFCPLFYSDQRSLPPRLWICNPHTQPNSRFLPKVCVNGWYFLAFLIHSFYFFPVSCCQLFGTFVSLCWSCSFFSYTKN